MNPYEGPRNGDYVAYVDKLLRASPEFRRTSHSIASAVMQASATPGSQSESPLAQMREKLQQAREAAQPLQPAQPDQARRLGAAGAVASAARARPAAQGADRNSAARLSKAEARRRFQEIEREIDSRKAQAAPRRRPWVSPFVLFMVVAGAMLTRVSPALGTAVSLMAWFSLLGNLIAKLRGR
ncbi:hypothetical protein [Comamonas terrae]|uniref:Uncharacterized protein n=1 Tax=Comamonas terrae TaxID=673548 RepID=A0ABW5UI13_9BURK|nr:hypothetical protein [Comamonas terrae]